MNSVTPPPTSCAPGDGAVDMVAAPVHRLTLDGSWDENWFGSPALVDVNGDGALDIVATRHSVLYVWSGDGTPLWQTAWSFSASDSPEHGSSRMWASPVVGDFDGDGDVEIAVGSDADSESGVNVAVYDHTGELLPGWPVRFGGNDEVRSIAAADVDGDGVIEILVNKTSQGPTTMVYELNGQPAAGWPQVGAACNPPAPAEGCWDFGGYNQNIGAADFDGDGIADVISTYDAIGFDIFHGDGSPFPTAADYADRVVTSTEAYHDPALAQQGWGTGDRSEFTYSPPVLADITGDGKPEVILAGDHEHSDDTSLQGTSVWVLRADLSRPPGWEWPLETGAPVQPDGDLGNNIVPTHPSPSVGNLDGQPGPEVLVPAYDGKLYAFRPDGTQFWSYTYTSGAPYQGAGEALVVDLNQDGRPEVVFTTYSTGEPRMPTTPAHLIVLSADGAPLHKVELFGRGAMSAPSVADLDDDGTLELVISLKDSEGGAKGGVQIWDLPGSAANCVLWGTGRGGVLRQGWAR